jgi:asparagine synthase (glutamine-hydrolysing)
MAHRRLAIIDLSPLGHQPMHLPDRRLSIVFNGEIYNFLELRQELERCGHRFRSHSDTEVILGAYAEWGTDCLSHLNGMFAFALYDAEEQQLFLARDRAGEKPLFYRLDGQTLHFASELKAFLTHPFMPRRIDPEALDCYLMLGYVPNEYCILEGYRKLAPAHALLYNLRTGTSKIWRYWELPDFDPTASDVESALVDQLHSLLHDSIARQLRADVPVGILLSGGVDSSLITAIAANQSQRVHTFSVGFPGHVREDETSHALQIARHFDTQHTQLIVETSSADLLARLADQFDEPMADSSMIPTHQITQLVREQCTVALGGDGGDELFGGYPRYSRLLQLQKYLHLIPAFRAPTARIASLLPIGFRGRSYMQAINTDLACDLPAVTGHFDAQARRRLMRGQGFWATPADKIWHSLASSDADLVQRATRADFSLYLPDDVLVKVDRASMANSLEVRAPFLDQQLIEFAFRSVPSQLKATVNRQKILLKRLTERLLPADFDRQRKQGFNIPMDAWLKGGPFRDLFIDVLTSGNSTFDRSVIQSIFRGNDRGLVNHDRLFALVHFELWREAHGAYL